MIENIQAWIVVIGSILGLVGMAIKLFTTIKALGKNEGWLKVTQKLIVLMSEAEKMYKDGQDKETVVLGAIKLFCEEQGIDFDEEKIKNYIRVTISFANTIKPKGGE